MPFLGQVHYFIGLSKWICDIFLEIVTAMSGMLSYGLHEIRKSNVCGYHSRDLKEGSGLSVRLDGEVGTGQAGNFVACQMGRWPWLGPHNTSPRC